MTIASKLLLAVLTTGIPLSASAGPLNYPYGYAGHAAAACFASNGHPYFECNYTTKTCLRGYRDGGTFAGVVLDDADPTTVLRHVVIMDHRGSVTTGDYDKGTVTTVIGSPPVATRVVPMTEDETSLFTLSPAFFASRFANFARQCPNFYAVIDAPELRDAMPNVPQSRAAPPIPPPSPPDTALLDYGAGAIRD